MPQGMKRIAIWHHKDGDHLALIKVPWWSDIYEWFVNKFFCPCCGLSGWLSSKSDKISMAFYTVWQYLLDISYKHEKEIYVTPIESGCKASIALWGVKNHKFCFSDGCPVEDEEYNMPDL